MFLQYKKSRNKLRVESSEYFRTVSESKKRMHRLKNKKDLNKETLLIKNDTY
jgi:hypothetical protein